MVCLSNEVTVQATVRDLIGSGAKTQSTILLTPTKSVSSIFEEVAADFQYQIDDIQLTLQALGSTVELDRHRDSVLGETGFNLNPAERANIIITQKSRKGKAAAGRSEEYSKGIYANYMNFE